MCVVHNIMKHRVQIRFMIIDHIPTWNFKSLIISSFSAATLLKCNLNLAMMLNALVFSLSKAKCLAPNSTKSIFTLSISSFNLSFSRFSSDNSLASLSCISLAGRPKRLQVCQQNYYILCPNCTIIPSLAIRLKLNSSHVATLQQL